LTNFHLGLKGTALGKVLKLFPSDNKHSEGMGSSEGVKIATHFPPLFSLHHPKFAQPQKNVVIKKFFRIPFVS
jgi:hypothetical protein